MADNLSEPQRDQIQAALFAGKKIQAIKIYRTATGAGLKDAKEAVEAIESNLRATAPEQFAAPASKAGCMLMLLLLLALPAVIAAWAWL